MKRQRGRSTPKNKRLGQQVQLTIFADPAGGTLVTGEMYCLQCPWVGNRRYNPAIPELEICPGCHRDGCLRPERREAKSGPKMNPVAVGGGTHV